VGAILGSHWHCPPTPSSRLWAGFEPHDSSVEAFFAGGSVAIAAQGRNCLAGIGRPHLLGFCWEPLDR
jgi:hypothetical protein